MGSQFTIKRGDTLPTLSVTIKLNGVAVDLTNVSTATMLFKRATTVLSRYAEISPTPADGVAFYNFVADDWTAVGDSFSVGKYSMEIELTFDDNTILTSPSSGYASLVVEQDLGPVTP